MTDEDAVIRARGNALLKRARAAARGREEGVVLLEGARLVADALRPESPLEVEIVLLREGEAAPDGADGRIRRVAAAAMEGLGDLRTTPPVAALARPPAPVGATGLATRLVEAAAPLRLVCATGVSDPGNLGAIARCAEAFGAAGLVIAGADCARPFGPKALRGSMGSLLRVPVHEVEDVGAALDVLTAADVESWTAATRGGEPLGRAPFGSRVALWVTGETAAAPAALGRCRRVTIPMEGAVESLNVSVAAALVLHEVRRRQAGAP